eukprot:COSAG01_NODE_49_length_31891_cov_29.945773_39_plen_392_part_00
MVGDAHTKHIRDGSQVADPTKDVNPVGTPKPQPQPEPEPEPEPAPEPKREVPELPGKKAVGKVRRTVEQMRRQFLKEAADIAVREAKQRDAEAKAWEAAQRAVEEEDRQVAAQIAKHGRLCLATTAAIVIATQSGIGSGRAKLDMSEEKAESKSLSQSRSQSEPEPKSELAANSEPGEHRNKSPASPQRKVGFGSPRLKTSEKSDATTDAGPSLKPNVQFLAIAERDLEPPRADGHFRSASVVASELRFRTGDVVEVLTDQVPHLGPGWSLGRVYGHSGTVGFFPSDYVIDYAARKDGCIDEVVDRSAIVRNRLGEEEPHSESPELWNIDGAEVDIRAKYKVGGQMWYLQTRATDAIKKKREIAGQPMNRRAIAEDRAFRKVRAVAYLINK